MDSNTPYLTYYFNGFKFEFIRDEIFITDERYSSTKTKHRLIMGYDHDYPIVIQLVSKE